MEEREMNNKEKLPLAPAMPWTNHDQEIYTAIILA
jgi:hypothetical protein